MLMLGPAGSGKSSLLKQLGIDSDQYFVYSTDIFRGVTVSDPESTGSGQRTIDDRQQSEITGQEYLVTQDISFFIKERARQLISEIPQRPNIIADCLSTPQEIIELLSNVDSKLAVFAGGPGYTNIPEKSSI